MITEPNHASTAASARFSWNQVLAGAAVLACCSSAAHALEGANPYFNGINIGVATGAAPPPGLYFTDTSYIKPNDVYDGNGNKTGIRASIYGSTLAAIYVPGWKLLGAQYVAFARQPIVYNVTKAFGETANQFGLFNTIISPFNLSWNLGGGFFASVGEVIYMPDGTYGRNRKVNIANNFASFEQGASVSYLGRGLNLTALANYVVNLTNNDSANRAAQPSGHYHSGDVFNLDLTATQEFGKFTVGAGAYLQQQITNDTAGGRVVGASPFNSYGNKAVSFALGPVLGYQLGPVGILAYYTRDVVHENTIGGNSFFLRLATRF